MSAAGMGLITERDLAGLCLGLIVVSSPCQAKPGQARPEPCCSVMQGGSQCFHSHRHQDTDTEETGGLVGWMWITVSV